MPQIFYASPPESEPCLVFKNGVDHHAFILERRADEVYVHYENTDKRLDEWIPEEYVRPPDPTAGASTTTNGHNHAGEAGTSIAAVSVSANGAGARKRKRSMSLDALDGADGGASEAGAAAGVVKMSEEEYDIEHHKQITAKRNFDKVIFGRWQIKTWYFSPYPLTETEIDEHGHPHVHPHPYAHAHTHAHAHAHRSSTPGPTSISAASHRGPSASHATPSISAAAASSTQLAAPVSASASSTRPTTPAASTSNPVGGTGTGTGTGRIPGVARASVRSHGRTSDLLAGGLGRNHAAALWVCDRCFKYMAEGASWELHVRKCTMRHPPGRKVYQRGAHIIWEVDGAKEKLYCQNLSLFGKLFIDIKTLFFDCDNFLFYILTDADSQRDHVLGFFSKEKISYDDYNLACIVVLPPYQKKKYGMLLIEFSYELSRRAGKQGTPERPLSDLGLRSYLTYWTATLIRYLRHLLSVLPPGTERIVEHGSFKSPAFVLCQSPGMQTPDTAAEVDTEVLTVRDAEDANATAGGSVGVGVGVVASNGRLKRRKSTKGWDGEGAAVVASVRGEWGDEEADPLYSAQRTLETAANMDGSATTHTLVECTLADIARTTGLRVEDAAFALNECGLLTRRRRRDRDTDSKIKEDGEGVEQEDKESVGDATGDEEGGEGAVEEYIVISREMVEAVARVRSVRPMCLNLAHVLL